MKFLIDTNIFIPLEPTTCNDLEDNTILATDFDRLSKQAHQLIFLHPAQKIDISNDSDEKRRRIREIQFNKYPCLSKPPHITEELEKIIGVATPNSNDWVDNQLLSALASDAVDYLVTEDLKIAKKAEKIAIKDRVISLTEAITIIKDLFDEIPDPPPAVYSLEAYNLTEKDPIFNSLRQDYPQFDAWLSMCKRQHRQSWVIRIPESEDYAGVCIVKKEDPINFDIYGKILKICTFKVSEKFNGIRLGELLLKTIFGYAQSNQYDGLYVEIFKKHYNAIQFFKEFGFEDIETDTSRGEIRLGKLLTFTDKTTIRLGKLKALTEHEISLLSPTEFNKKFGPYNLKFDGSKKYIIPIQPTYHALLFPEAETQQSLYPGNHPCGNSIRKAYLCNSNIRTISSGSILFFYRSQYLKDIKVIGITEGTLLIDA